LIKIIEFTSIFEVAVMLNKISVTDPAKLCIYVNEADERADAAVDGTKIGVTGVTEVIAVSVPLL
jgi:hypothetical protein